MVEEEDGRGESGAGWVEKLGNTGTFCSHGCCGSYFGDGRTPVSAARGVLGTDYNNRDYTIVAGGSAEVSWQRLVGTGLGAALGAIVASQFEPHVLVFGASVFFLGLICPLALADRSAYRFGGIALAIVLLIPRTGPAWEIAFHRFAEVSIGIGVALLLTLIWPEREDTPLAGQV